MEWQPIETAGRKPGVRIITFRPRVELIDISDWVELASRPAYWGSILGATRTWNLENPPTHWMPLPEPPK